MSEHRDKQGFYVLDRTYSELFKRHQYLTPLPIVQNKITEYDIRSANTSALRQARKIKPSTLAKIEALPKHEREVAVGKMIRIDKSIQKTISREITHAKMELFRDNGVQDSEILSIKNDAVFIIGRKLRHTVFGEMEFKAKNIYALYINIDKIEFYYDQRAHSVTVKGIDDKVVEHPDHQEGMMSFLANVMRFLVFDRRAALCRYLIEFSNAYKEKTLPVQFYRELNPANIYRTDIDIAGFSFNLERATDSDRESINGIYNYTKFVLPLIQVYI